MYALIQESDLFSKPQCSEVAFIRMSVYTAAVSVMVVSIMHPG